MIKWIKGAPPLDNIDYLCFMTESYINDIPEFRFRILNFDANDFRMKVLNHIVCHAVINIPEGFEDE